MMNRIVALILVALPTTLGAQTSASIDSLVARATQLWGAAPRGGWCVEWSVVRGDGSQLRAALAELLGSARTGVFTVTMRATPYAAPTLVARLRIGHETSEMVAAHALARASVVQDADILVQHTIVWGAPTGPQSAPLADIVGAETRRTLREGEVIRGADLTAATLVHAGDSVTAELHRDGVRLALVGTALHNAARGARVAIRLGHGRRFAGIATGPNTVKLD
jgi:flagella basal body P-ring formation protein FlgA